MKHFLIKYRFQAGTEEQWRDNIVRFVAALNSDPELAGKISYRSMRNAKGADCYHLATVADDSVNKLLQSREFFARFSAGVKSAAGGEVEVVPLEIVAETRNAL